MATLLGFSDYWWGWGNLLFHVQPAEEQVAPAPPVVAPRVQRLLVGLGQPALPLAARGRGDRVDRLVVLLHRARPPPRPAGRGTRRRARRGRRGVGGPRGRLLPRREVQGRASRSSRAALLVQVGGVHDVALGLRALRRRLFRASTDVPGRSVSGQPLELGGDRDRRRRPRAGLARLRRSVPLPRP